jgi:hypothetical protein
VLRFRAARLCFERGHVFGVSVRVFVRSVGFRFGTLGSGAGLHGVRAFERLFVRLNFVSRLFDVFFFTSQGDRVLFRLFVFFAVNFLLYLFENRATCYSISRGAFLRFFVLRFRKLRRERSNLIFVEVHVATHGGFGLSRQRSSRQFERSDHFDGGGRVGCCLRRLYAIGDTLLGGFRSALGFRARIGEQPPWQTAGETPGHNARSRAAARHSRRSAIDRAIGQKVVAFRLLFFRFVFNGRRCRRGYWLGTILGERLAG